MTVTHSGTGTPTSATGSASSVQPVYPTTAAGEKAVIHVNLKPFSATLTTPTGFQLVPGATNPATNGSTASGTNTGSTKEVWFESILPCDGTEGGTTVTITVTSADSAGAVIHTAATSLGAWDTSVFASGNKVGNTANMSATSGTQTSVAAGDMFYIGFAQNASLGTPSADALTQTGVTFGTVTNRSDRAITTGNDTRNRVNSVPVTSVTTPSGGATASYTNASSTSGCVGFLRLRDMAGGPSVGNAAGAVDWVGVANGARASSGAASGAVAWVGVANGARASRGASTGAIAWSGVANGARASRGASAGAIAWSGVANGARASRGGSTGTVLWNGVANGARPAKAGATGTITWVGAANGIAPTVGGAAGTAAGAISWVGVARGTRQSRGASSGAVAWSGAVNGKRVAKGAAAGSIAWVGAAAGKRAPKGSATGAISWAGATTGSRTSVGFAAGTLTWVGLATGTSGSVVTAPTPDDRIYEIPANPRIATLLSGGREHDIDGASRLYTIPAEDRTTT